MKEGKTFLTSLFASEKKFKLKIENLKGMEEFYFEECWEIYLSQYLLKFH
jgi:hypothetical protein